MPASLLASAADGDLNDQLVEAVNLGAMTLTRAFTDSINTSIDVDMYKFTVTAGQRIQFDVDRPSGTLDSLLRLFDGNGVQLASNDDGPTPGEAATVESFLDFTFTTAGTFFVAVSSFPNDAYDPVTGAGDATGGTGAYRLTLTPIRDPNDQIAEALNLGAMTQARVVNDAIDNIIDVDLFKFTVTAGQRIRFDVDRPAGNLDSFLRLFNASGVQLASNDDGPTPGEADSVESFLEFTFAAAGTFVIGVSGFPNTAYNPNTGNGDAVGETGAYTLTLTPIVNDADDQIAEAINLGAMTQNRSASGSINVGVDVDMFRFTVTAGQRIQFDVDRPSGSLDSFLRLFDANGVEVAANDDGPNPAEAASTQAFLDLTFNASGTFFMGVSGFGNQGYDALTGTGDTAGSTGAYSLILSIVAAPPPPPASAFQIDLTFNGLTASQITIFNQAADRWEQIIVGDLPNVTFNGQVIDDLLIAASAVPIDGVSNILGQAAPDGRRNGSELPFHGFMQFDTADMAAMEANGTLFEVILHEMGHVLGVGTIWDNLGLLTGAGTTNPRFLGAQATAAFNQIFGANANSVPVEGLPSGPGSADSHWRESVFGNELMSPFIGAAGNPISRVTVASLADLGYTVNLNAADNYVPPGGVQASSLATSSTGSPFSSSSVRSLLAAAQAYELAELVLPESTQMPGLAQQPAQVSANGSAAVAELVALESSGRTERPSHSSTATGSIDQFMAALAAGLETLGV